MAALLPLRPRLPLLLLLPLLKKKLLPLLKKLLPRLTLPLITLITLLMLPLLRLQSNTNGRFAT